MSKRDRLNQPATQALPVEQSPVPMPAPSALRIIAVSLNYSLPLWPGLDRLTVLDKQSATAANVGSITREDGGVTVTSQDGQHTYWVPGNGVRYVTMERTNG